MTIIDSDEILASMTPLDRAAMGERSLLSGPLPGPRTAGGRVLGTISDAFLQDNLLVNAVVSLTRTTPLPVFGYNAFLDDPDIAFSDPEFAHDYARSNSPAETRQIAGEIAEELERRGRLARAGGFGFAASVAAGILSPESIIPGAALFRTAGVSVKGLSTARQLAKLGATGFGRGAVNVGLAGALQESIAQVSLGAVQRTRTTEEQVFNVIGASVLSGLLGGIGGALGESRRGMRELVAEEIREGLTGSRVLKTLDSKDFIGLGREEQWVKLIETLSTENPNIARVMKDPKSFIGRLWRKFGWRWHPQGRLGTSRSQTFRIMVKRLTDNPMLRIDDVKLGNDIGSSVEAALVITYGQVADSILRIRDVYTAAYRAGLRGMNEREFRKEVTKAMRRGDKAAEEITDKGARDAISQAAKIARETFDRISDDAERVGLLDKRELKGTALSYVTRIWNRDVVGANQRDLKDIFVAHFSNDHNLRKKPEELADQAIDSIMGARTGSTYLPAEIVGQAGPFRERLILVRDTDIEQFLENDIIEVLNRFVNDVAPQVELANAFRTASKSLDTLPARFDAAVAKAERTGDTQELVDIMEDTGSLRAAAALAANLTEDGLAKQRRIEQLMDDLPELRTQLRETAKQHRSQRIKIDQYEAAGKTRARIQDEIGGDGFNDLPKSVRKEFEAEIAEKELAPAQRRFDREQDKTGTAKAKVREQNLELQKQRTRARRRNAAAAKKEKRAQQVDVDPDDDGLPLELLEREDVDTAAGRIAALSEDSRKRIAEGGDPGDLTKALENELAGKPRSTSDELAFEDLESGQNISQFFAEDVTSRALKDAPPEVVDEAVNLLALSLPDGIHAPFGDTVEDIGDALTGMFPDDIVTMMRTFASELDDRLKNATPEQAELLIRHLGGIVDNALPGQKYAKLYRARFPVVVPPAGKATRAKKVPVDQDPQVQKAASDLKAARTARDSQVKRQKEAEKSLRMKKSDLFQSQDTRNKFFHTWRRWIEDGDEALFPATRKALVRNATAPKPALRREAGGEYVAATGRVESLRHNISRTKRTAARLADEKETAEAALEEANTTLKDLRTEAHEIDKGVPIEVKPDTESLKDLTRAASNAIGDARRADAMRAVRLDAVIARGKADFVKLKDKPGANTQALQAELENEIKDIQVIRDNLLNRAGGLEDHPHHWAFQAERTFRQINYMRFMGGVVLSSIPDIVMPFIVNGFFPTIKAWRAVLREPLKEIKANLTLKPSKFLETLSAKEELVRFAIALELAGGSRAKAIGGIENLIPGGSRFDRGVERSSEIFTGLTLINRWNAYHKAAATLSVMNRMTDDIARLVGTGKLSRSGRLNLAASGINKEMAVRIKAQLDEFGTTEGGQVLPRTQTWRGDFEAKMVFQRAVIADVRRTIITPSSGDAPYWMSRPIWRLMGQFRSFSMSATTKVLMSGLQRRDAAVLQGAIFGLMMGSVAWALKEMVRGRDPFEQDAGVWTQNAIDRSGLLGIIMDINGALERATHGRVGLSAITSGVPSTRMQPRNVVDAFLGPSVGTATDLVQVFGSPFGEGGPTQKDLHVARKLVPFNNLFYWRFLVDKLEGVVGAGLPEDARQARKRAAQ